MAAFVQRGLPRTVTVPASGWAELEYEVRPVVRGEHTFAPTALRVASPLGLWQHALWVGLLIGGLCLGLQCMVIEYARDVCGLEGANSSEFDPATSHAVIDLLPEQKDVTDRLLAEGADAAGTTPDEFAEFMRVESVKWGRVVKLSGMKAD